MQNSARNTALTLALALLGGCQSTTTLVPADGTAGSDAAGQPSLAGAYISDCTPSPQADGSTQYFRLELALTETRWDLDYVVHADAACAVPLVTIAIEGPYALERQSPTVTGAWEARFAFDTKSIRPEVDGLRDFLNGLEPCGASDFETGVAQDIYATGCPGFGQYAQATCMADYDLVSLDSEGLRFGARPADNNLCAPEHRPTALSTIVSRRR